MSKLETNHNGLRYFYPGPNIQFWNIEPFFDLPARYSIRLLVSLNYFRNSCLYELSLMRSLYPRKAYKFNFMFGLISP